MAVKKTQLYASLWASCDKLRGGMDSSEYKDYILTLLFMKYVTFSTFKLMKRMLLSLLVVRTSFFNFEMLYPCCL